MPPTTRSKRKHQQAELEQELCDCARRGDFVRARELVEWERVNVNCVNRYGSSPFILSAANGHAQVVRFLLANGSDLEAVSGVTGMTAFGLAAYMGNAVIAEILLEHGADVETQIRVPVYAGGYSPLGRAIYHDNVDMVALLLRFGANTGETRVLGQTYSNALHLACEKTNAVEIVQLLLDHDDGVDVNEFVPRDGENPAMSPLCRACRRSRLGVAQFLVENGARVIYNGVYPDAPCPLVHAVTKGSLELVRFLMNSSPFSESVANENPRLPVEMGEPPQGTHPLSPPLETAILHFKLEVAQLLVDRGARVNDRPFLWQCAQYGRYEIARVLLRAGADVNLANSASGKTPLWAAAYCGNVKLVQEFLKARADVSIRDNANGETPLGVAYRQGHKGVVYLLLRTSPHVWSKLEKVL